MNQSRPLIAVPATVAGCGFARRLRRLTWLIALVATTGIAAGRAGSPPAANSEALTARPIYEIKALYLFNFSHYVEWPVDGTGDRAPFVIGVLAGEDAMSQDVFRKLTEWTRGKEVNGRPIRVQRVTTDAELLSSRILYLGAGDRRRQMQALKVVKDAPVLTVSESDDSEIKASAMISFLPKGEQVKLRIDLARIRRAHLDVSAKLLNVADEIVGGPTPRGK